MKVDTKALFVVQQPIVYRDLESNLGNTLLSLGARPRMGNWEEYGSNTAVLDRIDDFKWLRYEWYYRDQYRGDDSYFGVLASNMHPDLYYIAYDYDTIRTVVKISNGQPSYARICYERSVDYDKVSHKYYEPYLPVLSIQSDKILLAKQMYI